MHRRLLVTFLLLAGATLAVLLAWRGPPGGARAASPAEGADTAEREAAMLAAPAVDEREAEVTRTAVPEPEGFVGYSVSRVVDPSRPRSPRRTRTAARDATLPVQVVSSTTGAVLPGARLYYRVSGGQKMWRNTATADGGLPSPDGWSDCRLLSGRELRLLAVSLHGAVGRVEVELDPLLPGRNHGLVVAMETEPERTLLGRVVDAEDGAPVAFARVTVRDSDSERSGDWRLSKRYAYDREHSDGKGCFEVTAPPWSGLVVHVEARGYEPASFMPFEDEDTRREEVVRLERAAQLSARVVGTEGRPVPGITLRLRGPESDWRAVTDVAGLCFLDEVTTGVALDVELLRVEILLLSEPASLVLRPDEPVHLEYSLP